MQIRSHRSVPVNFFLYEMFTLDNGWFSTYDKENFFSNKISLCNLTINVILSIRIIKHPDMNNWLGLIHNKSLIVVSTRRISAYKCAYLAEQGKCLKENKYE